LDERALNSFSSLHSVPTSWVCSKEAHDELQQVSILVLIFFVIYFHKYI
jgi:hypothetical protein